MAEADHINLFKNGVSTVRELTHLLNDIKAAIAHAQPSVSRLVGCVA